MAKRKPTTYTISWGDEPSLVALYCDSKEQSLELLKLEYDEKDDYEKPEFTLENVQEDTFQHCRICSYWSQDGMCSECERILQGKYYKIYWINLEYKKE